jgi:hypothetical protein
MEDMMTKWIPMGCAALLVAGCAYDGPVEPTAREQTEMSAALAGYVQSGPPLSCVNSRDLGGNRSIGEGAILFDGPTRATLYVNHPPGGCPEVGNGRALITRTSSPRLCSGDIAQIFDPVARMPLGSCGLGEFTPYRRVRR